MCSAVLLAFYLRTKYFLAVTHHLYDDSCLSQRKAILSAKNEEILNVLYKAQENFTGRVSAPLAADLQPSGSVLPCTLRSTAVQHRYINAYGTGFLPDLLTCGLHEYESVHVVELRTLPN